jgi:hypothetical protein
VIFGGSQPACPSALTLVSTPQELDAVICSCGATDGSTGCTDGGSAPSRWLPPIDWGTKSILLFPHGSDTGIWKLSVENGRITAVVLEHCQGIPPIQERDSYVVPRAKEVVVKTIPRGSCRDVP